MTRQANRFVLLDRDGVLNATPSNRYITSADELVLIDGAAEAVRILNDRGFGVLVVSNQQCVGKGLLSIPELDAMSQHLRSLIHASSGGEILDFFYCPHLAEDECACRKPNPGLIVQAQRKYEFDPAETYVVGDSYTDLEAALRAGCPPILVLTGNDAGRYRSGQMPAAPPGYVGTDVLDAARHILSADA